MERLAPKVTFHRSRKAGRERGMSASNCVYLCRLALLPQSFSILPSSVTESGKGSAKISGIPCSRSVHGMSSNNWNPREGLPFPVIKWQSVSGSLPSHFSHVLLFETLWTVAFQSPLSIRDSPGKSTGAGCHAPLQGIFLTQGSNPCLLHCRRILYHWATGEA